MVTILKLLLLLLMFLCIIAFGVAMFAGLNHGYDNNTVITLAISAIAFIMSLMAVKDPTIWPGEFDEDV